VISSSECGVVLFVVLCGAIWFSVLLRCSFDSFLKIGFSQLHLQSMIWASTLQIQKHGYSDHFSFVILFVVDILPLYAINLNDVSLFADSPFMFLAILNMWFYLMYSIDWNEWISFFFNKKKNKILKKLRQLIVSFSV
jgi:hypothetical protein